ncbi:MAG: PEGA domain-containing protein [Myxococcales bacterium]|nr:PEGA domain-containing protein [Myxococcales bacterium]
MASGDERAQGPFAPPPVPLPAAARPVIEGPPPAPPLVGIPAPPLTAPARIAPPTTAPGTGKTGRFTGKVMVARKSSWPAWLAPLGRVAAWGRERVPPAARPVIARYGAGVLAWGVGVLCGLWWAPGASPPRPAPARAAATPAAGAETAAASREPRLAPARVDPAPAARATCSVQLSTDPAGAVVVWGDETLGETPLLDTPVPCGRALVTLRKDAYEPILVTMTATPDGPVVFSTPLLRPEADVELVSEPPGAQVFVDDRLVGVTPARVALRQLETVQLRLEKTGYRPLARALRPTSAERRVRFELARARDPRARRAKRAP